MRDEAKLDSGRLITEIYNRPAIWNQKHMSYHNRDVTNRIWNEIAAHFNLPKEVLKAKWKGLRDTFRAEIKKEEVYRKSNYTLRPTWAHFTTLQFLREQMVPRPPIWERGNDSSDNDATSNGASEDSCCGIGASEGALADDPTIGFVNPIDRCEAVIDTTPTTTITTTTMTTRASKRTRSRMQPETRPPSPAATPEKVHCGGVGVTDDASAQSFKDDLSPAENSPTQPRSDSPSSSHNNNNNSSNNNSNNSDYTNEDEDVVTSPVKVEPAEDYENNVVVFGNVAEAMNNLDDNGAILESISNEKVLIAETTAENCPVPGQPALDPLEGNRYDDNYYFFMSLLPHIRTLPADRRMLLRMQMQQLVYQEVYKKTAASSLPTFLPPNTAQKQSPPDQSLFLFPRDS